MSGPLEAFLENQQRQLAASEATQLGQLFLILLVADALRKDPPPK
jgi:hypothetical protein